MRLDIHAVGRLKAGPERDLADRYLDRLARAGPAIGLEFGAASEIPEGRAHSAAERGRDEAARLSSQIQTGHALVVLDERGRGIDSAAFAAKLGDWRDSGRRGASFVIGGPDGLDARFAASADMAIAFGAMTWPHQIVRILLAEQLYRAVTILSGHPYHRA